MRFCLTEKGGRTEALAEGATSGDVPSDRGGPRVDHLRTDLVPPSHRHKRRPNGTSLRPSDGREERCSSTNDWVPVRVRANSKGHKQGSGCCPVCPSNRTPSSPSSPYLTPREKGGRERIWEGERKRGAEGLSPNGHE